jgi:hypothetical protein
MTNRGSFTRLWIALLFLTFTTGAFAQAQKQVRGYAVMLTGDTLQGFFINYKDWEKNPGKVSFTTSKDSRLTTLTPFNTAGFKAEGYNSYEAFSVHYLKSSNEFVSSMVDNHFDDRQDSLTAFLEVVFHSPDYKLLMLQLSKRIYFVQAGNAPPKELVKIVADQGTHFSEVDRFKDDLRTLFKDRLPQDKLEALLRNVHYTEKSLVGFFEKATGLRKQARKQTIPNELFVAGGLAVNSFKITGGTPNLEESAHYKTSGAPFFRVGLFLYSPRKFGKLFMSPVVNVYTYKNTAVTYPQNNYTVTTSYQSKLVVNPSLLLGANLVNTEKLRLFLSGGPGMLLLVKNQKVQRREVYATPTNYVTDLRGSLMTVNTQMGVSINNKLTFFASYILPVTITNNVYYEGRHSSLQTGIGYKLKL